VGAPAQAAAPGGVSRARGNREPDGGSQRTAHDPARVVALAGGHRGRRGQPAVRSQAPPRVDAPGEVLRMHAQRMLGDVHRIHAELEAVRSGLQGRLQVGTTLPPVLLPPAIARLQRDAPGIHVSVVESSLVDLLDKLGKREIDAVIGALIPEVLQAGFATEVLVRDVVQVVARDDHPFLREAKPTWEQTCNYPWIMPPRGSVMRARLDEAFAAQGVPAPRPSVEAGSSIRVQLLLSGGRDYLTVLSGSELRLFRNLGKISGITLDPVIAFPDIGVIWSSDGASALVAHLISALRIEAGASPQGAPPRASQTP
jgi:DNA-binding transcriptional LysR family regulator